MSSSSDNPESRHVIAVSGPVGGGKSSLVSALADALGSAVTVHFDHYEEITRQPIEQVKRWMQEGADMDAMRIPGLAEDLLALKQGRPVVDPMTQQALQPARYILFETQFGRQHAATGRHIDFMIWIDTPLDIALARKIRQFAGGIDPRDPQGLSTFVPWLATYLDNYLEVVGELLRIQRETVGKGADLVIDGMSAPDVQLDLALSAMRGRLS